MMMTHFGRHGMVSSGGDGGQAEEGVTGGEGDECGGTS